MALSIHQFQAMGGGIGALTRLARGLHDDAITAGRARFICILLAVAIGTTFMLILSSDWGGSCVGTPAQEKRSVGVTGCYT